MVWVYMGVVGWGWSFVHFFLDWIWLCLLVDMWLLHFKIGRIKWKRNELNWMKNKFWVWWCMHAHDHQYLLVFFFWILLCFTWLDYIIWWNNTFPVEKDQRFRKKMSDTFWLVTWWRLICDYKKSEEMTMNRMNINELC